MSSAANLIRLTCYIMKEYFTYVMSDMSVSLLFKCTVEYLIYINKKEVYNYIIFANSESLIVYAYNLQYLHREACINYILFLLSAVVRWSSTYGLRLQSY